MKKLTNLIKTTDPKKIIGLGVATAVGTAKGVKAVAKKRKQDLANSNVKQKAVTVVSSTLAAGSKVVGSIREDISLVVGSAKSQSCAARCAHCAVKDTFKPCCKDGDECKVVAESEENDIASLHENGKDVKTKITVATQNPDESEELPEPVKASDIVIQHEEADLVAEALKEVEAKADVTAKKVAKATAPRKPRSPRVAKSNAEPVSVKDTVEVTDKPADAPEKSEEK